MHGCPRQVVPDEIGRHEADLQEEQEDLHLRRKLKSARCAEIPGKEKGKTKRHQGRDRPPDLPVARTIRMLHVLGKFCICICLFHSDDPCKIFADTRK